MRTHIDMDESVLGVVVREGPFKAIQNMVEAGPKLLARRSTYPAVLGWDRQTPESRTAWTWRVCVAVLLVVMAPLVGWAQPKPFEDIHRVPVEVVDAYGKTIKQEIVVTLFKGWGSAPRPLLLLNHGRATDAQGRAALGRARYSDAAAYFAQRGFIVAVPTRVGYGVSGGEDIENTGACGESQFEPGFEAAAQVSLQVLTWLRQRSDVNPDRIVVAGQSRGGAISLALAAKNPAGVVAAINFAGGAGGNPKTRPGQPCDAHLMKRMLAGFGEKVRMPTLWIYAENDLFMGSAPPREWFEAFQSAGGRGEFVPFPPHGEDGHNLFARGRDVWQPRVDEFLKSLGF